jgi:competence protein ComEA
MNEALPRWRTFGAPETARPTTGDVPAGSQGPGVAPVAGPSAAPVVGPDRTPRRPGETATRASLEAGSHGPGVAGVRGSGEAPAAEPGTGRLAAFLAVALGGAAAGASVALLMVALVVPAAMDGDAAALSEGGSAGTAGSLAGLPATQLDAWSQRGSLDGASATIVVDVAGAVVDPGLHELSDGDRVADAISAAGGYGARVDLAAIAGTLNLAEPLEDGGKVVVPELGTQDAPAAQTDDERIDLNSADQAALESLPGIGPVTAGKIIAAREEQAFGAVDELVERDIVGESVYQDIRDLVRVGG